MNATLVKYHQDLIDLSKYSGKEFNRRAWIKERKLSGYFLKACTMLGHISFYRGRVYWSAGSPSIDMAAGVNQLVNDLTKKRQVREMWDYRTTVAPYWVDTPKLKDKAPEGGKIGLFARFLKLFKHKD